MAERIGDVSSDYVIRGEQTPLVDEALEHGAPTSISQVAGKLALEQSVVFESDATIAETRPIELSKRALAYVQNIFGDISELGLQEDDKLLLAQTLNGLRGVAARSPLADCTVQLRLLLTGLSDTEIGERVDKTRGSVVTGLSMVTKRIQTQPDYSPETAYDILAAKLAQHRRSEPAQPPVAFVPLDTITDQLREAVAIDEVKLKEHCVAINELESTLFQERMRQLPQYLPPSTSDTWIRIIADWLDGQGANELASEYGLDEHTIGSQLLRVSKIFLKERPASHGRRTLTSDDLEWQASALCVQTGGDLFFPDKGETTLPAKKICAACGVKKECKEYVARTNDQYGIWAAEASNTRRRAANAKKLR